MRPTVSKMALGVALLAGCGAKAALDVDARAAGPNVSDAAGADSGKGPATSLPDGSTDGPALDICPATSSRSMPRVSIGPDVDVRAFCNGGTQVPIASVDEQGSGVTTWSVTVTGDAAFGPVLVQSQHTPRGPDPQVGTNTSAVCQANSPEVAVVSFALRNTPPGSYDAIATVHADDGSFADGTVKLHGEVVAPVVTLDKTTVDFGDVAPGDQAVVNVELRIENGTGTGIYLLPDSSGAPYFSFRELNGSPMAAPPISPITNSDVQDWSVLFDSNVPGDYSASVVWTATPDPGNAPFSSCNSTTTMTLHARVVGDGGVRDADTTE